MRDPQTERFEGMADIPVITGSVSRKKGRAQDKTKGGALPKKRRTKNIL